MKAELVNRYLKQLIQGMEEELVERVAALEHSRWARWQAYVHSQSRQVDGGLLIPDELVKRWLRQISTPYSDLPEGEKESDRREAREYLPLFRAFQVDLILNIAARADELNKLMEKDDVKVQLLSDLDDD